MFKFVDRMSAYLPALGFIFLPTMLGFLGGISAQRGGWVGAAVAFFAGASLNTLLVLWLVSKMSKGKEVSQKNNS